MERQPLRARPRRDRGGFCGGFTTSSTISVHVFLDARGGDASSALLYLAVTIAGGVLAAALGYYAGRAIAA